MTNGTGYIVSNNTGLNAGTYTVTATLKNNYQWIDGTTEAKTVTCTINPYDISSMIIDPISDYVYDETEKEPIPDIVINNISLNSTDYNISYSNNIDVGIASIAITANNSISVKPFCFFIKHTSTFILIIK